MQLRNNEIGSVMSANLQQPINIQLLTFQYHVTVTKILNCKQ